MYAAALLHDWAHQTALWSNQGVVQLGGDGNLYLCDVCLNTVKQQLAACIRFGPICQKDGREWALWLRFVYQLLLNCQDAIPCSLTVCLLPSDDDHLRVAVLSRQVDFCVGFLSNLQSKSKRLSGQTLTEWNLHSTTHIISNGNSTFLMLDPPFPIMFLWNCLKMGTETEKLFST